MSYFLHGGPTYRMMEIPRASSMCVLYVLEGFSGPLTLFVQPFPAWGSAVRVKTRCLCEVSASRSLLLLEVGLPRTDTLVQQDSRLAPEVCC
jgi:hypothetical protein